MKQSKTFIPTLREVPSDAKIKSHQLLLRAGFIRQHASGVFSYLPLAKRILTKIEQIIREEMEAVDAIEWSLPAMQLATIWQESGRFDTYGPELLRLKDRQERDFVLGATDEEIITTLIRDDIQSYKKLPITLYQIQTKFRDEQQPRFGLICGREFIMKDAYSFHETMDSLNVTYEQMAHAYMKIFSRLGLNYRVIKADAKTVHGEDTQDFMVLAEIGEDTIVFSDRSNYAANLEIAEVNIDYTSANDAMKELEKIATPDHRTVEDVMHFLEVPSSVIIKSLVCNVDGELVIVLVRGDHELNITKLKNVLKANTVELAKEQDIQLLLGCTVGSIGPVKLPIDVKVIADEAIRSIRNGVAGANEDGYHFLNVNPERDFAVNDYEDIRFIQEGDPSPDGNGVVRFAKGIQIGHISKLGTHFSEKMDATFLDREGKLRPIILGNYEIGVSRILAIVAEQFQDDKGFVWPKQLAPYDVHIIPVNSKDEVQVSLAEELYGLLTSYRFHVLMDDRQERIGVKLADAELIGLPVRITVGKKATEGIVEITFRQTGDTVEWVKEEVIDRLNEFFRIDL